ncbi:pyrimidine/purine nucleoside phosphorylase [Pseudomonas sp. LB3P14]
MFKTNEYFGGAVKSIAFNSRSCTATIGVMACGEYTFSASRNEIMHVITGAMEVKLSDATEWETFRAGQKFNVPANTDFKVTTTQDTAYLCEYL